MLTFQEAGLLSSALVGEETLRLAKRASELPAGFVLSANFEEAFYRRANLPEQLRKVFGRVDPQRLDEDGLEVLCEQATTLVRTSALLDDVVQLFERAVTNSGLLAAPSGVSAKVEFHVRRPGSQDLQSGWARLPGHEVLFALKRLWAADWELEAVMHRLDSSGGVGLEARPVLAFAGPPGELRAGLGCWQNPLGVVGLT